MPQTLRVENRNALFTRRPVSDFQACYSREYRKLSSCESLEVHVEKRNAVVVAQSLHCSSMTLTGLQDLALPPALCREPPGQFTANAPGAKQQQHHPAIRPPPKLPLREHVVLLKSIAIRCHSSRFHLLPAAPFWSASPQNYLFCIASLHR